MQAKGVIVLDRDKRRFSDIMEDKAKKLGNFHGKIMNLCGGLTKKIFISGNGNYFLINFLKKYMFLGKSWRNPNRKITVVNRDKKALKDVVVYVAKKLDHLQGKEPKHLRLSNNITCKPFPQNHWQGIYPNRLLPEIFFYALAGIYLVKVVCVCVIPKENTLNYYCSLLG